MSLARRNPPEGSVHARTYATLEEAALNPFKYIKVAYNWARIHSALGYLSPTVLEKAN